MNLKRGSTKASTVFLVFLSLLSFLAAIYVLPILPVHATATYANDTFENFNTNSWWTTGTGGSPTGQILKSGEQYHAGTGSNSLVANTSGTGYAYGYNQTALAITTNFHYGIWNYLPSGTNYYGIGVSESYDGSAVDFMTGIVSNATGYYLECGSYAGTYVNVTLLSSDVWIHIEEFYVRSAGRLDIYVNGVNQSQSTWTTEVLANKSPNRFYLGDPSSTGTQYNGKIFYDDLLIDDAAEPAAAPTTPATINDFYVTGTNSTGNVTWAGFPGMFSFYVSDTVALDHAIFGCNNTGAWVNNANTSLSGTGPSFDNYTLTFNNTNCVLAFNYTVWNTNTTLAGTTIGLRIMRLYSYNSSAYAWNTPFNDLGSALETVESANVWGTVDTYSQVVLGQQPISALATLIDNYDNVSSTTEAYSYCNNYYTTSWQYPTYAYNNDTSTGSYITWSPAGYSSYLTLNLTYTTAGTKIRYWVDHSNSQVTQMEISVANQTGSWQIVWGPGAPTWAAYANATIARSTYTAMRFRFFKSGTSSRTAYVYETQGINASATGTVDFQNIIKWSAISNKLNITRQQAIKDALGNYTMVGSLPYSATLDAPFYKDCFVPEYKWALYGYWYANNSWAAANMAKWNITAAYNQFDAAVNYSVVTMGHNGQVGLPIYIYADGTGETHSNRYYDEQACTIDCYLIFYSLLNVSDALGKALYWWSYLTTTVWHSNDGHYNYVPSIGTQYECEASFFLKIISILKYTSPSLGNWTNILTDIGNRFLSSEWNSRQWLDCTNNISSYAVVHEWNPIAAFGNPQRRLQNTLGAWQALLGVYAQMNTTYKANMLDMVYGTGNVQPAWALLFTPDNASFPTAYPNSTGAGLFNASSNLFSIDSADAGYSYIDQDYNATAQAEILLFMLGVVPGTTTVAFPLEELDYEYLNDIDPYGLQFSISQSQRIVTVPVNGAGTMTFQYGKSPITVSFNQSGVWVLYFSDSWNVLLNSSYPLYMGSLPSNVIYFNQLYPPPTYSNMGMNTTIWGQPCNFTITVSSVLTLTPNGQYIFGCNNTGPFTNETAVNFTSTPQTVNVVKTLNSTNSNATHPEYVTFEWWFSDNTGTLTNTGLQILTLSWPLSSGWNNVTIFSFDVGYTLAGINASLNYDNLNWSYIVYQNSSTTAQYAFVKGMSVESDIVVYQTSGILLIFCGTAGNWTHTYPYQGGGYGSDPTPYIAATALSLAIVGLAYVIYRKRRKTKAK